MDNLDKPFAITIIHEEVVDRISSSAYLFEAQPDKLGNYDESKSQLEWVVAVWDTGAQSSCISDRLAKKLNLKRADYAWITTASSEVEVPTYVINLGFPNGMKFFEVDVVQFRYGGDDSDFIIGMDIISQGDFSITNFNGKTIFSFHKPSLHSIDYEAELRSQKD